MMSMTMTLLMPVIVIIVIMVMMLILILILVIVVIMVVMMVLILVIVIIVVIVVMVMMLILVIVIVVIMVMVMMLILVIVIIPMLDRFDPTCRFHGFVKVKAVRIQHIADTDFRIVRLDDDRLCLKASNDRLQLAEIILADHIDLVHEDRVTEFKLLDQKVFNIFLLIALFRKAASVLELIMHTGTVDDCYDVVEHHRNAVLRALLADVRDRLRDRNRLTDAGCLDDNIIEIAGLCEISELCGQIISQCAADAAVRERDQVAVLLCHNAALCDQIRIYVDFADIVDDHGCADPFIIAQDMVQQSCLACAEIPRDQGNFNRFSCHE